MPTRSVNDAHFELGSSVLLYPSNGEAELRLADRQITHGRASNGRRRQAILLWYTPVDSMLRKIIK